MSSEISVEIKVPDVDGDLRVQDVRVKTGLFIPKGQILATLRNGATGALLKIKADSAGKVSKILKKSGDDVKKGDVIMRFSAGSCDHPTIMKNMCAECGADLEQDMSMVPSESKSKADKKSASIAIVHSIPELKVSTTEAHNLGREDEKRLLKHRRLVLLVDLDQTLIHTTNENIPANMKDVYHFQLYGPKSPWYHTRIRPGTASFLKRISQYYELHICTFGARLYAHTIAGFLDTDSKFFSHRILSRDECFDSRSKTANLSSLFPCGDHMVCIIDDREDVWNFAPNLVHVKPYNFFKNTGDINAPPGAKKVDNNKAIVSSANTSGDKTTGDQVSKTLDRRDSIDMPNVDDSSDTVDKSSPSSRKVDKSPTTLNDDKLTSNESIDDKTMSKDKMDDAASMVSDDLELSDDDDDNDGDGGDDSSTEEGEDKSTDDDYDDSSKKEDDDLVDVEDHDDYLMYLEDILKSIHKAYFDLYDQMESPDGDGPDLKTVIPYVKRKVLQGCVIVFSGVVPTHVKFDRSKPYMVAKSMGAVVDDRITDSTTHLVAARTGTAKFNEARKRKGVTVVTPDWLWSCAERWEKADERLFALTTKSSTSVTLKPPAHCSSPEITFAERCSPPESKVLPETMNPLLAFSSEDLEGMDKEVEDILSGHSSSSSSSEDNGNEAMDMENLPKIRRKRRKDISANDDDDDDGPVERFRRGEDVPSDYEIASQSDDEEDDKPTVVVDEDDEDEDELGAQLERDFLGDFNSNSSFTNE